MLSYVVAIANNGVIGKDNKLPWYLPKNLQKFKQITTSETKIMIMGRKTFESLPKILPDRHHIVLTRNENYRVDDSRVTVIKNVEKLTSLIENEKEYFVIGGEKIFSLLFPYVKKMYITKIEADFHGDTFFHTYNRSQWKITERTEDIVDENNKYKYKFITLERA